LHYFTQDKPAINKITQISLCIR